MLFRALEAAVPSLDKDTSGVVAFAGENLIASWAINEILFAFKNNIMRGIGENLTNPLGNTTREHAIALVKRVYGAFQP
ncbi:MAG: hypothetical protein AB1445_07260 [Bacillota bacterium]